MNKVLLFLHFLLRIFLKRKTNKKLGNTNKKNKIIEKPSVLFVNLLLNKCVYSDHFNLIEDFWINELHYFR